MIDVPGKTVGEALAGLVSQHPDLKRHLYTEDGKLRTFVNVYVNDEDMRYLQKEATVLKDGDTISIVPSIAGGCCYDLLSMILTCETGAPSAPAFGAMGWRTGTSPNAPPRALSPLSLFRNLVRRQTD